MNNHHHRQQQQQQFQQNMQMGSGLTRYQSAPSSYFSSLLNSTSNSSDAAGFGTDDFEQLFNPPASTPDTQKSFRFMNTVDTVQENCASNINLKAQLNSQFLPPRKSEPELHQPHQQLQRQQSNDYSSVPHIMYHSHNSEATNSAIPSSYANRLMGSINSNPAAAPVKMEGGSSCGRSNLIRHSSSPAGLFKNPNIKNEIAAMGNFGACNNAYAEAASFSSANRFKSQMDFSSRQTSSSGMMATISEIGSKGTGENNPGDELLDENRNKDSNYIPDYPINSWDDSVILSDNFLKELAENDQGNEGGKLLSHHLSLPKSSAELFAMEQLLQDTVPCKIRAKRGFATHPRSIAERVRRTKISQRMRKLQELVPNMEKQTNTADMLNLAVDYIKDLQRQVKTLSDNREKCYCSAKQEIVAQREGNR